MSELMNSTPLVPQLQTMLVASATLATEVKRLFGSPSMMGTPVCQVLLRLAFWCAVKSWDQPASLWKNGTCGSSPTGANSIDGGVGYSDGLQAWPWPTPSAWRKVAAPRATVSPACTSHTLHTRFRPTLRPPRESARPRGVERGGD